MVNKVSFGQALYLTKLSVYLAYTWPPPANATKWETTKYVVGWWTSLLSAVCLLVPLVFAMSKYRGDSLTVTQTACFIGATLNLIFKMVVCRIHMKRTQNLISEMEDFVGKAEDRERIILQRYVDRFLSVHGFISVVNYLATAMGVTVPLLNPDQSFPTRAVYPFAVDSGAPMYVAYLHQALAGFQCSAGVTIDCQVAAMMWFAGARLEILAEELEVVSDMGGIRAFVRKHRELLAYASDVSDTMSYIAIASSTACGIAAIMSSLQLFGNQPFFAKVQFGPIALIALMNLFICAWPADNLINVCECLGNAVYNISWTNMSKNVTRNVLLILQRCQTPVVVSVAGFLPNLNLQTYASFLSAAFSYFTTLRLVVMSDAEN